MTALVFAAVETVLDRKAEIVCAYIEAAGIITETEKALAAKGIKVGRQKINSIIRNDPKAVEWTKNFFDKAYTETCGNRLEAVSAQGIQKSNELVLALMDKTRALWFREVCKPQPNAKKLEAFSEFVKWQSISLINQNLVYSRFRDGLHSKAPFMTKDDSQHKTEILNVNEGRLSADDYASLRAHADRFKQLDGRAGLPIAEQSRNGTPA